MKSSVTLIFTRSRRIGSWALRRLLWSRWSHCAIVVPGGNVIEAMSKGVIERSLEEMLAEADEYEIVSIPCPNPDEVIKASRAELGKGYDWLGLFGFGFRRQWHRKDRWFCSELVAHAFAAANFPLVRYEAWRISPPMLYLPIWR